MVKPVDDAGGNGVRLCSSERELVRHTLTVLADTPNERGQRQRPAVLIEEYVDGPEFSAEVLIRGHAPEIVALTAKKLGELHLFIETGHVVAAAPAERDRSAPVDVARRVVSALGLDFGAAHVEMRLTADGPRLIEVNCRPAGGWITRLVQFVTGVNTPAELVATHLGVQTARGELRSDAAATACLPAHPGC